MSNDSTPPTRLPTSIRDVPLGTEHGWCIDSRWACRTCGSSALLHPDTNAVWGCKLCGLITQSPFVYFKEVE